MNERPKDSALSPALRNRVLEEISRTPAPTRTEYRRFVLQLAAGALVLLAASFLPMGGLVRGNRPDSLIAFTTGCAFVVAAGITLAATRGSRSMLGPSSRRLAVTALVGAPLWALLTVIAAARFPAAASENASVSADVLCALLTILQGAIPLGAFLLARRGSDPVHPVLTGVALGIAGGAWAVMMAYIRCPHASVAHGIVAHVVPTLLLAAAGALLGRALLVFR